MRFINLVKSRFFHSPFRLIHDVTYRCNCKCKICERWKKSSDYKNELTTEEIFEMLNNAKKAGIIMYAAQGGEPLLRKDLPQILQYAKKLNFVTTVITNGFYLKERFYEILPFTDYLFVSIDSNDELHDEMRGLKGLREKAIEGIRLCKNSKTKITINSVICNLNLDKVEGLVELSEELSIPILFQPMGVYKGYNENIKPTQSELKKTFSKIIELKKAGYKVSNSYNYLQYIVRNKSYACHAPKCFTYVKPNGNIESCCFIIDKVWGNVKEKKFKEIFESKEFKEYYKKMENCNKCCVYAVIETSLAYSLHPRYLFENIFTSDFFKA
jgi:MoaA/NifB/PqqE/SkfB family radical SAM enzyme